MKTGNRSTHSDYGNSHRSHGGHFRANKGGGWGMNLYRNTRKGRIAGVCAGLADHWDVAPWVMRLIWIGAIIFTGTLALWAYLVGWALLAPRPTRRSVGTDLETEPVFEQAETEMEYDERYHDYRPRKVFRYSDSGTERLARARERLEAALRRVENMETYVTSKRYSLDKEFAKL